MIDTSHIYLVIMAGGSGTRLWPLSRKDLPKQFLKIGSADSLVRETAKRLLPFVPWERVWVVCGEDHGKGMIQEFPELTNDQILLEPCARNTAQAIALAAHVLKKRDPEAIMTVLPADHKIPGADLASFQEVVRSAVQWVAEKGGLLTLGVTPRSPATGYGYIHRGDKAGGGDLHPVYQVRRFQEKPDLQTAQGYLKSGDYFWNSGMFVWRAADYLAAYERFLPQDAQKWEGLGKGELKRIYPELSSISVDYAILEKSDSVFVMPAPFAWDDVGSLNSLMHYFEKDRQGNAREGAAVALDSKNNLLYSDGGIIACLGVENLIVLKSQGAVLVIPRERAEEVKVLLEELKKSGYDSYS